MDGDELANGYAAAVDYDIYGLKDHIVEEDGGRMLLFNPFCDTYASTEACVPDVHEFHYTCSGESKYVVLNECTENNIIAKDDGSYDTVFAFLPDENKILKITCDSESHSNHVNYELYYMTEGFPKCADGVMALSRPVREQYHSIAECIPTVLAEHYQKKDVRFVVLGHPFFEKGMPSRPMVH